MVKNSPVKSKGQQVKRKLMKLTDENRKLPLTMDLYDGRAVYRQIGRKLLLSCPHQPMHTSKYVYRSKVFLTIFFNLRQNSGCL